ncbi:MAG TPA: hypothetical protein VFE33_17950 [Thermoanaerobaculia bacterium]|nr:hypothetical protein [Thermoanaerobaculia bacterium]
MKRPMLRALWLIACTLALPALAGADTKKPVANFRDALARSCSAARRTSGSEFPASCLASSVTRRVISGNVVEYSLVVRTGPGEHDRIGLHRVVQESAPNAAAHARHAILFAHGDAWGFDGAFLANLATPGASPDHAAPVFLAEHGVDVWGIDFGWTLVPAGATDFTFLRGWGIDRDARDLGIALALARVVRLTEGNSFDKIDLLGWSRGGQIGYAYLNAETQAPRGLRQVKGFVPVDIFLKTDDETLRQAACARAATEQATVDAGTFENTTGVLFQTLGNLALTAPAAASPVVPGFTNRQAGLVAGSATYVFFPPGLAVVPFYHFAGGTFDGGGLPTGLSFTPENPWFHFETGPAPFESQQVVVDGDDVICNEKNVSFDDHLAQITVPVLYLGAGGGFGDFGVYTTTLLGSHDVTTHVVHLVPAAQRALDIGHADIWNATDAPSLFWQPILGWIGGH